MCVGSLTQPEQSCGDPCKRKMEVSGFSHLEMSGSAIAIGHGSDRDDEQEGIGPRTVRKLDGSQF